MTYSWLDPYGRCLQSRFVRFEVLTAVRTRAVVFRLGQRVALQVLMNVLEEHTYRVFKVQECCMLPTFRRKLLPSCTLKMKASPKRPLTLLDCTV